ncbi:hypothetical protein EW026_g402 [Hermanssonia centrifuga]|uniref:Uncharacterized protein n=1 Tax=Hermanssonia centrifuga TaxID=98765 RepID=A0A4S4KUY7_9APHY|nr:hypothetical protein EW026_g402 [Hermanssonia centrifuga]
MTKVINPLSTSNVATYEDAYHRRLAYSSGPFNATALHLARQARLLLCMRDSSISLFKISSKKVPATSEDGSDVPEISEGGWEPVLDMDLNVNTNLVASAISDNGEWVVVSDWYESKLFHMETLPTGELKPTRIKDFASILQAHLPNTPASTGASSFNFTPDSSKLIMTSAMSAYVLVIDLTTKPRILRRFDHHRMRNVVLGDRVMKGRKNSVVGEDVEMADAGGAAGSDESDADENILLAKPFVATVTRTAVSPDGQWLATSDDRCRTHVFNLDSIQHHCTLPSFPQPAHALSFDSTSPSILVLGLANNTIQVYDVESRTFPLWSRELTNCLPQRFTHLHDTILGVTFDLGERAVPRSALFWGATWLCRVQLDAGVGWGGFEKKRRWGGKRISTRQPKFSLATGPNLVSLTEDTAEKTPQNFKMVTHYRPIIFVDFIAPAELVVVERPLVDVLAKLPPAFFKPKYGAT